MLLPFILFVITTIGLVRSQNTTENPLIFTTTPAPVYTQCWTCDTKRPLSQPVETRRCKAGIFSGNHWITCPQPNQVCGVRYDITQLDEAGHIIMSRGCLTAEEEAQIISKYPYSDLEPLVCDKATHNFTGVEISEGFMCTCQGKLCNRFPTDATNVAVNNVGLRPELRQALPTPLSTADVAMRSDDSSYDDYYAHDDEYSSLGMRGGTEEKSIDSIIFGETVRPLDATATADGGLRIAATEASTNVTSRSISHCRNPGRSSLLQMVAAILFSFAVYPPLLER